MTQQEIEFITDKLISFISSQKEGIELESIIDYLDYVNRVKYSEEELIPLLDKLCQDQKMAKSEEKYIGI